MNNVKIPSEVSLGGQELTVTIKDRIEGDNLGECCVAEARIEIAETLNGREQKECIKINTFYHELVHAILDTMGEYELSKNEKFVCCFSSFLCEAMRNAYFVEKQ